MQEQRCHRGQQPANHFQIPVPMGQKIPGQVDFLGHRPVVEQKQGTGCLLVDKDQRSNHHNGDDGWIAKEDHRACFFLSNDCRSSAIVSQVCFLSNWDA